MPGGRPTVVTKSVLLKLEQAFLLGCTDLEACFAANISKSTLYKYCDENPEFSERKEALKKRPVYMARAVVVDALAEGDRVTAHKVLDREDGIKSKQEVSGPDGGPMAIKHTIEFVD